MATIAETFLEDLENSEKDYYEEDIFKTQKKDNSIIEVEVEELNIDSTKDLKKRELPTVHVISQLNTDSRLIEHMKAIEIVMKITKKKNINEQNDKSCKMKEHTLIVRSNELLMEIEHHIFLVHQFITEIYNKKLPELASMVQYPVDYAKCVRMIGDRSSEELDAIPLKRILTQKLALMVQVTATTTLGKPLGEEELRRCQDGVDYLLDLNDRKEKIINYINSRMEMIAPNVSAICGEDIAAQLISLAGGIEKLATIPSCNIQVLGSNKSLVNTPLAHHGLLINCEIVKNCSEEFKQKALRLISNKVCLASRIDANQSTTNKKHGQKWHKECVDKVNRWSEPPIQKPPKSLPAPDPQRIARKRGGKRYRAMREKWTPTDTQRMTNRLGFNVPEEEILTHEGEFVGLGMLGKHNLIGGAIRTHKIPIKKKLNNLNYHVINKQKRLKQRVEKAGAQTGMTTSMIFTSVQGIELNNPECFSGKKNKQKYFNNNDVFSKKN